jgi:hypothetical protein
MQMQLLQVNQDGSVECMQVSLELAELIKKFANGSCSNVQCPVRGRRGIGNRGEGERSLANSQ